MDGGPFSAENWKAEGKTMTLNNTYVYQMVERIIVIKFKN